MNAICVVRYISCCVITQFEVIRFLMSCVLVCYRCGSASFTFVSLMMRFRFGERYNVKKIGKICYFILFGKQKMCSRLQKACNRLKSGAKPYTTLLFDDLFLTLPMLSALPDIASAFVLSAVKFLTGVRNLVINPNFELISSRATLNIPDEQGYL